MRRWRSSGVRRCDEISPLTGTFEATLNVGTWWIADVAVVRQNAPMLHTRDLSDKIVVDGLTYEWAIQREPQWCTADGWRGLVLSIRRKDEPREALLEFPVPKSGNGSPHRRRPTISKMVVVNGVRAALAAGWEPTSRGKPDTYMVDVNGC